METGTSEFPVVPSTQQGEVSMQPCVFLTSLLQIIAA